MTASSSSRRQPAARVDSLPDRLLAVADNALKTLVGGLHASRPMPQPAGTQRQPQSERLDASQRELSGRLMRVNHVGEICAQALYQGQALAARDPALRAHFSQAARDECDHLAWCSLRLEQLDSRPSMLDPLWYAGALALGALAGGIGEKVSLGFVVETENQVEQHLASHLQRLPQADLESRAVVEQMKNDEVQHALAAEKLGAVTLPAPVRWGMRAAAKVMTTTAHWI
ncbi:MAG: 2-polyprenyl-3-methyl-6-methoxy-1,4-benzoquinone monooxygenase [Betaproteobacteria bacterium]|nr:2-polyprenyl-3-methyl-6-methoxy-1,4-benzoquinone monooxygenase [Betaproteobacteria bacterium]